MGRARMAEGGTVVVTASENLIGSAMGCVSEASYCVLCIVAHGGTHVQINITVAGQPVRDSPFDIPLQPMDLVKSGCGRPGVSRMITTCSDYHEIRRQTHTVPDCRGQSQGRGMFDGKWGGMDGSGVCRLNENVYLGADVCLHRNEVLVFNEEQESTRTLSLGSHWWGLPQEEGCNLRLRPLHQTFEHWVAENDAEVRGLGGTEVLFLVPEGPMTHFGHMLTDSVLPLFATMLLDDGIAGDAERRHVVLLPRAGNACAVKGGAITSHRFWDLFHAVTPHPLQDVRLLVDVTLEGVPLCFRQAVIGQELDLRAGYGFASQQTTVPFRELFPLAARSLVRRLLSVPVVEWAWVGQEEVLKGTIVQRGDRRINAEVLVEAGVAAGIACSEVQWEGMSLRQQLDMVTASHLLGGVYGAGLVKSVFLRERSVLLVVLPYCLRNASDFWEIAQEFKLRHYVWRCQSPRCSSCPSALPSCVVPTCGDFPPEEAMVIGGMEGGPMLQDTIVDASDAGMLLRHAARALRDAQTTSLETDCALTGPESVECSRDLEQEAEAEPY